MQRVEGTEKINAKAGGCLRGLGLGRPGGFEGCKIKIIFKIHICVFNNPKLLKNT